MRAIVECDGEDVEMVFLTNNFEWAPSTIVDLYKQRWGIEAFFKQIKEVLEIEPGRDDPFPINVDGSTMLCRACATFKIVDRINLISKD